MFLHPRDVEERSDKRVRRDSFTEKHKDSPNFLKLHVEGNRLLNTLNLIGNQWFQLETMLSEQQRRTSQLCGLSALTDHCYQCGVEKSTDKTWINLTIPIQDSGISLPPSTSDTHRTLPSLNEMETAQTVRLCPPCSWLYKHKLEKQIEYYNFYNQVWLPFANQYFHNAMRTALLQLSQVETTEIETRRPILRASRSEEKN